MRGIHRIPADTVSGRVQVQSGLESGFGLGFAHDNLTVSRL